MKKVKKLKKVKKVQKGAKREKGAQSEKGAKSEKSVHFCVPLEHTCSARDGADCRHKLHKTVT